MEAYILKAKQMQLHASVVTLDGFYASDADEGRWNFRARKNSQNLLSQSHVHRVSHEYSVQGWMTGVTPADCAKLDDDTIVDGEYLNAGCFDELCKLSGDLQKDVEEWVKIKEELEKHLCVPEDQSPLRKKRRHSSQSVRRK